MSQDTHNSRSEKLISPFKIMLMIILIPLILFYLVAVYWSIEPELFDVKSSEAYQGTGPEKQLIVGYTTVNTTIQIANTLLSKPGGYLSNDVLPPSVLMDNIPAWEYGALVQVRDISAALRNHISRSQSQSLEDPQLKEVEPLFNNDRRSWVVPIAESKYQEAIDLLVIYRNNLSDSQNSNTQFYARADNLRSWLEVVEKRLGSLSQRLTASVGQERENTDLAGDASAAQSTEASSQFMVKTPWLLIDDNFYEARGTCWALIHLMKAIEIDFQQVLEKKNARVSLRQIIRELESTQEPVWGPLILNGDGFGILANHSLVMASYVSRANAAIIDLRELLSKG